jgi:hypothetical protein
LMVWRRCAKSSCKPTLSQVGFSSSVTGGERR